MKTKMMLTFATAISALMLSTAGFSGDAAKSELSGIWDMSQFGRNGHPRNPKLTDVGQARFDDFSPDKDPNLKCVMPGVPLGVYDPYPLEIIEQDHQVVFLYEHFHMVRRIFLDGREADADVPPTLVGFSVGHWEGDTLVVKTTNMQENLMWNNGRPFSGSEDTYMIEHYRREGDLLVFDATVYDSENYEEPYRITGQRQFNPEGEIFEYECYAEYGGVE